MHLRWLMLSASLVYVPLSLPSPLRGPKLQNVRSECGIELLRHAWILKLYATISAWAPPRSSARLAALPGTDW